MKKPCKIRLDSLSRLAIGIGLALSISCYPVIACNEATCSLSILPTNNLITATVNGNWDNASTWSLNRIPAPGDNVVIPSGKKVTWTNNYMMDATSSPIRSIRIDGELYFVPFWKARLVVDTIAVSDTGKLAIASESRPMDSWHYVEIIFAGGDLDLSLDPNLKGRGLISHGTIAVYGQDCSPYVALGSGNAISADRKTITLASTPTNWKVNASVVVTGDTHVPKTYGVPYTLASYTTKDEVRKISAISGNTITLDQPLTSGFHDRPFPGMPIMVGYLDKNVRFMTSAANAGTRKRRAHSMFMTSPNVVIEGAAFLDMGRSDKTDPLTEVGSSTNANMKGRYPIHIHQIGQEKTTPVRIKRCLIRNSPGWGIALHSSYGDILENFTFEIFASHIVAEEGDERGQIKGNLAVKSVGDSDRGIKVLSTIDTNGHTFQDDGQRGHGFWFQSRNLDVQDNFAISHGDEAFVYFHRNVQNVTIPVANLLTPHRTVLSSLGYTELNRDDVPIAISKNNVAVGSEKALHVIKANPAQGHDIRNMFEGLKGYEVSSGVEVQYTGEYTFRDCEMYRSDTSSMWNSAFQHGNRTLDMVHVNFKIQGWSRPFYSKETFSAGDGTSTSGGIGQDVSNLLFVDGQVQLNGQSSFSPFSLSAHHWKDINEPINGGTLWYVPSVHKKVAYNSNMDLNSSYTLPAPQMDILTLPVLGIPASKWTNARLFATGVKTDSAGVAPRDSTWEDTFSFEQYWSGGTLRPIATNNSYWLNGKQYIDLQDHAGDRVSGKIRTFGYTVELTPYVD